jgi:hypothetical protein
LRPLITWRIVPSLPACIECLKNDQDAVRIQCQAEVNTYAPRGALACVDVSGVAALEPVKGV